jgi:nucleoside-diphosphate-sugar epimerase
VYGASTGVVDDDTEAVPDEPRARQRLAAEGLWRAASAVVLRAPGIYGPDSGLHHRLATGGYRLPGDGSGVVSRIHVDDLGALLLAALDRGRPGAVHVVGDLAPTPHVEVVRFLCDRLGLPMPPSAPLDEVSPTLRRGRRVDPSPALAALGVTLRHPTYRDGYGAILDEIRGRSGA